MQLYFECMNYSRGNEINFKIVSPNIISFSPRRLFLSQPFIIFIVQEDILYLSSYPPPHLQFISFRPLPPSFSFYFPSSSHFIPSPPLSSYRPPHLPISSHPLHPSFSSYPPPNIPISSRPNPFALSSYTHIPILSHPLSLSYFSFTGFISLIVP